MNLVSAEYLLRELVMKFKISFDYYKLSTNRFILCYRILFQVYNFTDITKKSK